ncbi:MAG: hypothetical protein HC798_04565 [Polaribacter sp.]|nr:hypothetical protein [Polaribacter sp.]
MQLLTYELLKLDEAALEQGKKEERKSNTNQNIYNPNNLEIIQFKNQYLNQIENLNRQLLPLQNIYKKR